MPRRTSPAPAGSGSPRGEPVYLTVGFIRRPHGVRGELIKIIDIANTQRGFAAAGLLVPQVAEGHPGFAQQGHQILTDDILPLEDRQDHFIARPGFPALRMWPDQAGHFFGDYENLDRVHPEHTKRRIPLGHEGFGTFCNEEKPLKVVYMPKRLDPASEITIEPLSKKNAFIALIQNSFTAGLVEVLGLQPGRMDFFSRMVRQVPVRRLYYPDGFHHLPRVVEAVLEDSRSKST